MHVKLRGGVWAAMQRFCVARQGHHPPPQNLLSLGVSIDKSFGRQAARRGPQGSKWPAIVLQKRTEARCGRRGLWQLVHRGQRTAELVHLFQCVARTEHDARQWIFGDDDRQSSRVMEYEIEII